MSEDNQIVIPESFLALYLSPGRSKPRAPHAEILARYELCEDMAQMLLDTANTKKWELGVETQDIVARIQQGLQGGEAGLNETEAQWIAQRLAELMD
jgi:hypothetical protein